MEELLDFYAPKLLHRASEKLKKKFALGAHGKALRKFQDHCLRPLLHTVLHLGMRSMHELPPSHAGAIKDRKEMQHLSRLVALYAFGALSNIRLSRRKVMFDALRLEGA